MYRPIASTSSSAFGDRLLGNPFRELCLSFFLLDCPLSVGNLKPMANLVYDVQVILYVFKRTIIRQLGKQGFNVFLCSAHHCPPLPLTFNKSSKMRIAFCSAMTDSCDGVFDFDFKAAAAPASFSS